MTEKPTTSETIETLLNRVSVRKFTDEPIADTVLDNVLAAALRAPTSSNLQAYSVIVVRDAATKAKLVPPSGGQQHIADCPVFLAFCADLTRIEHAFEMNGHTAQDNNLEMGLVSSIDASLVGMAAYVAADSVGLHGVMIGGMRNDPELVADILGLPNRTYVVFGMCLGYPAEAPKQKPRMAVSGIVHHERYDVDAALEAVTPYDQQLKAHYEGAGKATTDASWSDDIDNKFSSGPRPNLRAQLKGRGFDFL